MSTKISFASRTEHILVAMSNRAEKDAVRWCHLTHQVFAGASVHSREHKTSLVRCTDIFSKRLINHSIII